MWLKETKPDCCIDYEPLPTEMQCLAPDFYKEMYRLFHLHSRSFVQNRRIMELAKPKTFAPLNLFKNRCPCFLKKNIEIIRLDQRENTRTEQLSYPRARQLLMFKQEARKMFSPDRIINLNRLIRKSLFSLYSRLANVQPPRETKPIRKWNKLEWEAHTKILKKLAKHKVVPKPSQMPEKRMPLKRMKRYKQLAKPKVCYLKEKPGWIFTRKIRDHKASERTNRLAKPVIRDTTMLHQELPIEIPRRVLKHKASERINELCKSNKRKAQSAPSDLKENPFVVSRKALKTKASKRTNDLAQPREYENKHIRENPYAISKAALKAKAKPRTIALAKAKKT